MKKKISIGILLMIVILLMYYLFFRSFEFQARFKANTVPGDIIQSLRIWTRSLDSARIIRVDSFNSVTQVISVDDRSYNYEWLFFPVNDSVTSVEVRISQPGRSKRNKLLIPFTEQAIEQDAALLVRQFHTILQTHLLITRVNLIGEAILDSVFCLCSPLQTNQIEKANGMMRAYPLLTSFVNDFNLEVNGRPMVKVNSWDHSQGLLQFDFCFPIRRTENLPSSGIFTYKLFPTQKVLKAEYFGNYITSDRAWYELIKFAQNNNYEVAGLPTEVFHNNPNLGMNEKDWKAEIFLPVEKTTVTRMTSGLN